MREADAFRIFLWVVGVVVAVIIVVLVARAVF
jgi:t-SNARE complex subunit (syntaxin)